MKQLFKPRLYRAVLFWKFFASYFTIIVIPVLIACSLADVFVVHLIEKQAEKTNLIMMRNFSEKTDAGFSALQTSMVNLLTTANVKSAAERPASTADAQTYFELIHSLMDQLRVIDAGNLASSAFLYFTDYDLVIGADNYSTKEAFFRDSHPVDDNDRQPFFANFTGKKMMSFSKPYTLQPGASFADSRLPPTTDITALMSYPFNSDHPDVYLAVNLDVRQLTERIGLKENWVTGTAIVDRTQQLHLQSAAAPADSASLLAAIESHAEGTLIMNGGEDALFYLRSHFNDAWSYVSFVDMDTLLKPANLVRSTAVLFLAFFWIVGAIVSYSLSRRMYKPIQEIKLQNKQMSALIDGISPIVEEDFMSKILLGEFRDSLSIEYYAREIGFRYLPKATRFVICMEIQYYSGMHGHLSETSKSFIMTEIREHLRRSSPEAVWLCQTKPELLACIVQNGEDAPSSLTPERAADLIRHIMQQYGSYFKATVAVGSTVGDIGDLHLSYASAVVLLQMKSLHPRTEIFYTGDSFDAEQQVDCFITVDEANLIVNVFKSRRYDKLLEHACEWIDKAMHRQFSAHQVKNLCSDILNAWIRAVETEYSELNVSYYTDWFNRLNRCVTWEELKTIFEHIHRQLFREEWTSAPSTQISSIVDYIHSHYGEELTIEQLAERLSMSISHFSRTFKEEVGEKYVEYIAKYRISMAKRMLQETDLKIDEIAEKVGYMGRNSFIRMFRKYEGITPGQYRLIYPK